MTAQWFDPPALRGRFVHLVPLAPDHAPGLAEAAADGDLHRLWYTSVPRPDAIATEIDERLAPARRGAMVPFATLAPDGVALGMTTFCNLDATHRRLEIGHTWLRRSAQRTPVNTEAKRLMLAHAFDALDCIAVEFRTHAMNGQSRRAIERLGAKLDGILRSHRIMPDGSLRDTAVYSVTAAEWPAVRANLDHRLAS